MTSFAFFELLGENVFVFIFSMILAMIVYLLIANKIAGSWMNPIKLNVFTAGIGLGVVLFLFFTGNVSGITFVYILTSSLLFWGIIIGVYGNTYRKLSIDIVEERFWADRLFWVLYILYIASTILSYKLLGIPIFNDNSRLAVYVDSGGLGVIQRIQPIMCTYSIFYLFYQYYSNKCGSFKLVLLFVPIVLIGILSGSRSSFLTFIFAYWGVRTFYFKDEPKLSKYKKLLILFLAISILTFFIQSGDFVTAATRFVERVIACGDLYWQALPGEAWSLVKVEEPVRFILTGLLAPLRILDISQAEVPIGYQLTDITYPDLNRMTGPIALFPVGSLVLYGYYGGLIFTVIQALLAACAYRLVYIRSNSIIVCAICYYIFVQFVDWFGDITAAMSRLFDVMISAVFVCFILLLIGMYAKLVKIYE